MSQSWDPERYARHARFVSDLGAPVVELLAPRPGERILDVGCGDGALTAQLVAAGCQVIGVDASAAQIEAAQGSGYMSSPDLDDRQKTAIRWAEAVTLMQARDDDEAFAAMRRHFSEKQIVELTVFCGMWNYSNRLCEALHIELERPDRRIEFRGE